MEMSDNLFYIKGKLKKIPFLPSSYQFLRNTVLTPLKDPASHLRFRYRNKLRGLSRFMSEQGFCGVQISPQGDVFIRTQDDFLLFYNVFLEELTLGDGQSLEKGVPECHELEELILRALSDGSAYLDVGANNGYYYCLKVARRFLGCKVYAFEPDPAIRQHLKKNIEINGFNSNITVVTKALSHSESVVRLTKGRDASGFVVVDAKTSIPTIPVECTTLDIFAVANALDRIDVIKVDIEGGELNFLKGAMKTLSRWQPLLVMELNEVLLKRSGASIPQVKEILSPLKYEFFRVKETNDMVLVPPAKKSLLPGDSSSWLIPQL